MPRSLLTGKAKLKAFVKVNENGCWIWQRSGRGCKNSKYSCAQCSASDYPSRYASHWSYTLYKGPITPGLQVLHKCDVPMCVNPRHLWLGTIAQNMADCKRKGRRMHGPIEIAQAEYLRRMKEPVFYAEWLRKLRVGQLRRQGVKLCAWCGEHFTRQDTAKFCNRYCTSMFYSFMNATERKEQYARRR